MFTLCFIFPLSLQAGVCGPVELHHEAPPKVSPSTGLQVGGWAYDIPWQAVVTVLPHPCKLLQRVRDFTASYSVPLILFRHIFLEFILYRLAAVFCCALLRSDSFDIRCNFHCVVREALCDVMCMTLAHRDSQSCSLLVCVQEIWGETQNLLLFITIHGEMKLTVDSSYDCVDHCPAAHGVQVMKEGDASE